ncbi:MAG: Outer membrane protein assembly factor BamA precursor [candidate division TA06 bacterium ADurb.Bin417]|uniref:Outer membrane protein assembly factor BamA n=1 Tax=candidate division TA06 bacterium ADurb.Bin417 TaxID=1852828 RepID=A0A1V5MAX7_UNCT6|nr:MAG: Outer membrane protein assembly factor BamA precursor [candidate division TA06 bacterium ADurb.Bin417]
MKVAGATRPAGRHLEVDFSIEEGRRYLAGPVNFSGDLLHTPEKLRALVRMKDGAPYSQAGLEADRSALLNLYRDDGYLKARVEPVAVFNAASERVDLGYQVNPGPVVEVEGIEVSGNTRTREGVIRREIKLAPGDRFDGRQLRRSIENLRDLNYFEDVNIQPEEGSAPEKAVLNFEVKERERTGNLMFGAGYSSVDGLIGLLAVEQNNFDWHNPPSFIGGGQTLRLSSDFGRQRQGYSLSFTNPYIYDRPVLFGFDLYDRARDYDEFDERRTGGGLRFGRRVNNYWSVSAMPRAERVDVSDISPFASTEYLKEEGENDIYSLTLAAARDTRDSRLRTTRGTRQELSYKYAGGWLGGDRDFWRGDYDFTYYRKLGPAWTFSSQTRLGIADTMGSTSDVPVYERYFCGGARTVRGYEDRSLGPLDASGLAKGGNFTLIQNLEFSRPIYQDILHLVLFADSGQAWWRANDFDFSELKSSLGAGLRLKVPIFPLPIKLDYGYALDPLPGEDSGRWHFLIDWWF